MITLRSRRQRPQPQHQEADEDGRQQSQQQRPGGRLEGNPADGEDDGDDDDDDRRPHAADLFDDATYWSERVRALAVAAATTTRDARLAEWASLARADGASAANVETGRRAAKQAARTRRYWHVCLAASQGDLCGAVLLNPRATSRAQIDEELRELLGCTTARSAVILALKLVAVSIAWRRVVLLRPAIEEEVRCGWIALTDLREVVRSYVSLRLKIESDGNLTPVERRLVRDPAFDLSRVAEAAHAKGADRRIRWQHARLEQLRRAAAAGGGGGGGGGGMVVEGEDGDGMEHDDDDDDSEEDDEEQEQEEEEEEEGDREASAPPLDDAPRQPPPRPEPVPLLPPLPLPELGDCDLQNDSGLVDDIVDLMAADEADDDTNGISPAGPDTNNDARPLRAAAARLQAVAAAAATPPSGRGNSKATAAAAATAATLPPRRLSLRGSGSGVRARDEEEEDHVVAGRPMTRARLAAPEMRPPQQSRPQQRRPPATARPSPPLPQPQHQQQPTPPQQPLQQQPPHQQQLTPPGGATTTTTTTTSADGVGAGVGAGAGAAAVAAAVAVAPASTAPRVTHLSPGDIAALAAYVGPLALAHGERELGAFVVGGEEEDGGELRLNTSKSSSPQLAGDVARCFCAVGLLLGKLGGEASARANWRAFVQRPGALALGLGLSFTSVTRFEQATMMTADTLAATAAADDVADGTASLVLWVAVGAASAGGSRFRLHFGSSSCALRHGTMLIVPPCSSSESGGGLRGVRVVEVEADGGGGGGGEGGGDDDQQQHQQLIALHFFVNRRVLDACASLGVQAVHAIAARGLA